MKLSHNILSTFFARLVLIVLAFISSIVLARSLGPTGRGLFALVLLLPELAITFGRLGFDQANTVYAGLKPEDRNALVWQSAIIAGVVGGVISMGGICFLVLGAPGFPSLLRGPLWLYVLPLVAVPFRLIIEFWGSILRGMNRIFMLNSVEVGTGATSVGLVLLCVVALRFNVAGAVGAQFVVSVGGVVLMGVLLRYVGVWGVPSVDRALWSKTTRFAMLAYCGSILSYLNYRADAFILALFLPPAQLGFYDIAVGFAERLWLPTGAIATALLPHLTNSKERDPALAAIMCRHVIIWTAIACLLLYLLADVVVGVLYSSAFAPVVLPLRWLLPGIFTLSIAKVLVAEIVAREKVHFTALSAGFVSVVNIVGNFMLIPRMGTSGAALASSISYTLLSVLVTWYYLKETQQPWSVLVPRSSDILVYVDLLRSRSRHDLSSMINEDREDKKKEEIVS
jgi:O-antigen/teichoic acid export membrane protein